MLTSIEKYNLLSKEDQDSLGRIDSEEVEETLSIAAKQVKAINKAIKWIIILTTFSILLAGSHYILEPLTLSFRSLLIIITGMLIGMLPIIIIGTGLITACEKVKEKFKQTSKRQIFDKSVNDLWMKRHNERIIKERAIIEASDKAHKEEIKKFQNDIDTIIQTLSTGKEIYVSQSLLEHPAWEIKAHIQVRIQYEVDKSAELRNHLNQLLSLIDFIQPETVCQAEITKRLIQELLSQENISEDTRSNLTKEYTKLNMILQCNYQGL